MTVTSSASEYPSFRSPNTTGLGLPESPAGVRFCRHDGRSASQVYRPLAELLALCASLRRAHNQIRHITKPSSAAARIQHLLRLPPRDGHKFRLRMYIASAPKYQAINAAGALALLLRSPLLFLHPCWQQPPSDRQECSLQRNPIGTSPYCKCEPHKSLQFVT